MDNVIIIGGGPGGWTAALYTARANLSPLVLCGSQWGGQLMLTTDVENYPGFPESVAGPKLIELFRAQAQRFGARILEEDAEAITPIDGGYEVRAGGAAHQARSLIIATGASARMLGLPSEKQYLGRGVSTCATCDGYFFRDKDVVVVGGGDSALEESLFLAKVVRSVRLIHRRDSLRASKIMQDRAKSNPKISFVWNSEVVEVLGDSKKVTGVLVKNVETGEARSLPCAALFLAIGHIPNTKLVEGLLELDAHGFIVTDKRTRTNRSGVFAAGDVQDPIYRQAVTAAASGCQAALEVERYLEGMRDQR